MAHYIISYDITEDRARVKIVKKLEQSGCVRLQKSVFFAPHFSAEEIRRLRAELALLLTGSAATNSLFCLPLSKEQAANMQWLGADTIVAGLLGERFFELL
jgi:CRISPR-associated protein Cas2